MLVMHLGPHSGRTHPWSGCEQVAHQIGHATDLLAKGQSPGATEEQAAFGVTVHHMPQLLVDAELAVLNGVTLAELVTPGTGESTVPLSQIKHPRAPVPT